MKNIILLFLLITPLSIWAQKPELIIPVGHKDAMGIYDFDVSFDHKLMATMAGKVVKIWDYQSGVLLKTFQYETYGFSRVKFTPDGKKLLVTGDDAQYKKHLLILDTDTYEVVKNVSGNAVYTWCLALSTDGQTAFVGDFDKGEISKINLKTGIVTPFYTLKGSTGIVNLSLSPDGKRLLALFAKGEYKGEPFVSVLLPTAGGAEKILTQNIQYQCFTPKGNLFSFAMTQNNEKETVTYTLVWSDPNTLKEVARKELTTEDFYNAYPPQSLVGAYDFFENSDRLLFTFGKNVWLIDPNQAPKLLSFTDPRKNGEKRNPETKFLKTVGENAFVVGTKDNFVLKYSLKNNALLTEYGIGVFSPKEIFSSPTGKTFTVAGYADKPYLISWEGGRTHIQQLKNAKNQVYLFHESSLNVSPDGTLAAYFTDNAVKIVAPDGRNIKDLGTLSYGYEKGRHLAFSPDNKSLIVCNDDNNISSVNLKTGVVKLLGKGVFEQGVFSVDSRYFVGLKVDTDNKTIITYFDLLKNSKIWEITDAQNLLGDRPFAVKNEVGFVSLLKKKIVFLRVADGTINREEDMETYRFTDNPLLEAQMRHEQRVRITTDRDFWHSKIVDNGAFYVQSQNNNTIQIFRGDNNKKVAEIILSAENGEWAVVTPEGLFDASETMMHALYYTKGKQIIPLETLSEKFYTPNLLAQIFSKSDAPEPKKEDINNLKAPPSVKLTYEPSKIYKDLLLDGQVMDVTVDKPAVQVTAEATCAEGTIEEIRLYHNGKLVGNSTRNLIVEDEKNKTEKKIFTLELSEGENRIKVVAINNQRTESKADEILFIYKPTTPSVSNGNLSNITLHLLVIGINKYKNPKYNLNYATADATSFKEVIERGGTSIFSKTNIVFIGDDKATKAGISMELDKIKATATAKDVFIFYYAGHGVLNQKKDFFLVPYDVTQLYGQDDALAQKGLSANELQQYSKDIKAQKQLFILDACQSAGALEQIVAARGAAEEKAIAQLARATGTHWLTASGSEQFASEFEQLKHGTFTYVLLEALSGKADKGGDKKITVKELDAYLQEVVPELTAKYKGTPQYPSSYGFGNDFPIGVVKN